MYMKNLEVELKENTWIRARGIVIGESKDGKKAVTAYFIMGRSSNSRNRVFVEDGDGIRTQAFDPAKLEDPSLIIYARFVCWEIRRLLQMVTRLILFMREWIIRLTFEQSLRDTVSLSRTDPNYTPVFPVFSM